MFELKYVSKSNDNLIQFLLENILKFLILCGFYKGKIWNFSKFILKLRVFSEILNLDNQLVSATLNC